MDINYLIQLLGNRYNSLVLAKDQAFMSGDLDRINTLDVEINSVQETLGKLKLALEISSMAGSINTTPTELMTSGVSAVQKAQAMAQTVIDNPTGCMEEYDISTYAIDSLHEQKIVDILGLMGVMNAPAEIDAYIDSEAIGSPLTGQMILNATQKYSVDTRLAMAIMELDSRFGTAGVAINTFNPGNVGNTGTESKIYRSWEEGVDAVAEWLSQHRKVEIAPIPLLTPEPMPEVESTAESESEPIPETTPEPEPEPTPEPELEIVSEPEPTPTPEPTDTSTPEDIP